MSLLHPSHAHTQTRKHAHTHTPRTISKREFHLCAESEEERATWVKKISEWVMARRAEMQKEPELIQQPSIRSPVSSTLSASSSSSSSPRGGRSCAVWCRGAGVEKRVKLGDKVTFTIDVTEGSFPPEDQIEVVMEAAKLPAMTSTGLVAAPFPDVELPVELGQDEEGRRRYLCTYCPGRVGTFRIFVNAFGNQVAGPFSVTVSGSAATANLGPPSAAGAARAAPAVSRPLPPPSPAAPAPLPLQSMPPPPPPAAAPLGAGAPGGRSTTTSTTTIHSAVIQQEMMVPPPPGAGGATFAGAPMMHVPPSSPAGAAASRLAARRVPEALNPTDYAGSSSSTASYSYGAAHQQRGPVVPGTPVTPGYKTVTVMGAGFGADGGAGAGASSASASSSRRWGANAAGPGRMPRRLSVSHQAAASSDGYGGGGHGYEDGYGGGGGGGGGRGGGRGGGGSSRLPVQAAPSRSGRGRASSLSDVIRERSFGAGPGGGSGLARGDALWLGGADDVGKVMPEDILPLLDMRMGDLIQLFALYARCPGGSRQQEALVGGQLQRHSFMTVQDLSRVLNEFDVVPTFLSRSRLLQTVAGVLSNPTRQDAVVQVPTERGRRFSVGQLRWVEDGAGGYTQQLTVTGGAGGLPTQSQEVAYQRVKNLNATNATTMEFPEFVEILCCIGASAFSKGPNKHLFHSVQERVGALFNILFG